MNSRVHPKYKTKYRVRNWAEYDRAPVQRGDITLWFAADAMDSWTPGPSGKRGGQRKFSDQAIETALVLRIVFHLPLRQAEGFLRSVLSLMALDLEAPDHTTLSRRTQHVDVSLRLAATKGHLHLIVDSTGLSIIGEVLADGNAQDSNTALNLIDEIDDIRLRARHPKSQEAEALIACNILNRMTELGRPESFAIGPEPDPRNGESAATSPIHAPTPPESSDCPETEACTIAIRGGRRPDQWGRLTAKPPPSPPG
jgi:hypothetical protein